MLWSTRILQWFDRPWWMWIRGPLTLAVALLFGLASASARQAWSWLMLPFFAAVGAAGWLWLHIRHRRAIEARRRAPPPLNLP